MKAAVMYPTGDTPLYEDFPEPVVRNEDELLIRVKAAAIKHIDRSKASGTHYSTTSKNEQGTVIGGDGVGLLADGTRVYAIGVSGMAAEQAVIEKSRMVKVPEKLDDATAAALPNAVIGAAMGLRFRGAMKKGEVVLINGATGFTGRVAVQIAKYYGAGKIIATGRDPESLKSLLTLGADEVISVRQDDEAFLTSIRLINGNSPIDVIVDYLWGHSAELLLSALKGKGSFTHPVRFVSVGGVTGDKLQLSAGNLRSVNLQLLGSGLGSWTREEVGKLFMDILPEMFQLAAEDQLKIETVTIPLQEIESIYRMPIAGGKRLVVKVT